MIQYWHSGTSGLRNRSASLWLRSCVLAKVTSGSHRGHPGTQRLWLLPPGEQLLNHAVVRPASVSSQWSFITKLMMKPATSINYRGHPQIELWNLRGAQWTETIIIIIVYILSEKNDKKYQIGPILLDLYTHIYTFIHFQQFNLIIRINIVNKL